MKAWELTGCMPGPPSHLHHPALLFSWVAGLITDPCWHAIAHTHTYTHTHTHTCTSSSLSFHPSFSLLLSFFPSFSLSRCHIVSSSFLLLPLTFFLLSASFFLLLFLCHSVTFSSLTPCTFYLSFCVSLSPVLLYLMLLSVSDSLLSPLSLSLSLLFHSVLCPPFSNYSFFTPSFFLSPFYPNLRLFLPLKGRAPEGEREERKRGRTR